MPSDCYPSATPDLGLDHTSPSAVASAGWGVASTHPQAERWAAANLHRLGFQTYLPLCMVTRRDRVLRSLTHRVETPLFPGYLFVWIDAPWGVIRNAFGVKSLLMAAGKPGYAPEAEILRLQAGEAARRSQMPASPLWRPGDASSQAYGPFQGLPSVVKSVSGGKAVVTLMMLGGLREITVPVDCLVPRDD